MTSDKPPNADGWNPDQYDRFQAERTQPFHDLLALVAPVPGGHMIDAGCGTGELTALAHDRLAMVATTGIDTSAAMLARAPSRPGLEFRTGDLRDIDGPPAYDVVLANASLHWAADHAAVLAGWTRALRPGGQLAVQVPSNVDHPSHATAVEVARALGVDDAVARDPVESVLPPQAYAQALFDLGYEQQHVRLQVYPHVLPSSADVIEWVRGTNLTRFARAGVDMDRFLAEYRTRLLAVLGERAPYFYAFKRILMWGRLPA